MRAAPAAQHRRPARTAGACPLRSTRCTLSLCGWIWRSWQRWQRWRQTTRQMCRHLRTSSVRDMRAAPAGQHRRRIAGACPLRPTNRYRCTPSPCAWSWRSWHQTKRQWPSVRGMRARGLRERPLASHGQHWRTGGGGTGRPNELTPPPRASPPPRTPTAPLPHLMYLDLRLGALPRPRRHYSARPLCLPLRHLSRRPRCPPILPKCSTNQLARTLRHLPRHPSSAGACPLKPTNRCRCTPFP